MSATATHQGLAGLLDEYHGLRVLIAQKVRAWFPVGLRVRVPARVGTTDGEVLGYHGSDPDVVIVSLGTEERTGITRRAFVLAADLLAVNPP